MGFLDAFDAALRRYGLSVVFLLVVVLDGIVFLDLLGPSPRTLKLVLLTVNASAVLGYGPAVRIVDYLWRPRLVLLLVVDATDNLIQGWWMQPDYFQEMDIDEGRLHQWEATLPVYECLSYDAEEHSCRATHRATATDLELLEDEELLEDLHGELSARADWGTTLRMRFLPFVRSATADQLESFTEAFEDATLPDGDAIADAVDAAKPASLKDDRGHSKEIDETMIQDEAPDDLDDLDADQEVTADD